MSKRLSITLPDELYNELLSMNYVSEDGTSHQYSASQKIEKAISLLLTEQKVSSDAPTWDDPTEKALYDSDVMIYKMMEERRRELGKD
jgi:hypothetical protein